MFIYTWIVIFCCCVIKMWFDNQNKYIITYAGRKRINSISIFIDLVLVLGVFILIVANRTGPDIQNYRNSYLYKHKLVQEREILFFYFRILANSIGIDFYFFRSILVFTSGIFVYKAMRRLNISIATFLCFYMPVLLFMDSGQLRNAICVYILTDLLFLLIIDGKTYTVLYVLSVILLSQIHTACVFYLFIPVIKVKNEKKRNTILIAIILLSMALVVMTALNNHRVPFVEMIYKLVFSGTDIRGKRYYTTARYGFLYPLVVHIILSIIMAYGSKRYIGTPLNRKYLEIIKGINACTFIVVPFMMMNITYYRYLRNAYFISIIGAVMLIKKKALYKVDRIIVFVSLSIITVLWGIFEVVIYDTPENILYPVLRYGIWIFSS